MIDDLYYHETFMSWLSRVTCLGENIMFIGEATFSTNETVSSQNWGYTGPEKILTESLIVQTIFFS